MGIIRRPSYYKDFQCISSACTDSCCQGWEIDIDEDTLAYYQSVKGDFGKRLADNIALPDPMTGEPAHFIQVEQERCPFLNQCNLCDIILTIGEEHISHICTHHPRYYDWLLTGQEAGIGLVCEEAARLILRQTGYPEFEILDDGAESEEITDEDLLFEKDVEDTLFSIRETLFHMIKDDPDAPLCDKLTDLFAYAPVAQDRYDDLMFSAWDGEEEDAVNEVDDFAQEIPGDWNQYFWNEKELNKLLDFYLSLEINDENWYHLLQDLRKNIPLLLEKREAFAAFYKRKFYEYEQLLIYFLYRYLMKAREDDAVAEKIHFAILSTEMIHLMDIYTWWTTGSLESKQQVDNCKLYSKEIEYDEDNMEALSFYFTSETDLAY